MTAAIWLSIGLVTAAFAANGWENRGGPEWVTDIATMAAVSAAVLALLLALVGAP